MYLFLVAFHVVLSLSLVGIILLQPGKGSDAAAAFGGGSGAGLFGPRGPASGLTQVTAVIAVLFMATSISLALYSDRRSMAGANDVQDALQRMQEEQKGASEAGGAGSAAPSPEASPVEAVPSGEVAPSSEPAVPSNP
jgi:preprotein translocase subunit SecG